MPRDSKRKLLSNLVPQEAETLRQQVKIHSMPFDVIQTQFAGSLTLESIIWGGSKSPLPVNCSQQQAQAVQQRLTYLDIDLETLRVEWVVV